MKTFIIGFLCSAFSILLYNWITDDRSAATAGTNDKSAIVVDYDSYGIPYRCAYYDHDIGLEFHSFDRTSYHPVNDVEVLTFNSGMKVVRFDGQSSEAEKVAYTTLGLNAESCKQIQARLFDAEYEQYIGPGDDYGHAQPEDDRTPL